MDKSATDNRIVNIECKQTGLDEAIEKVSRLNELLEAVAKHKDLLTLATSEEVPDDAESKFQFLIREERGRRVFHEFDSTSKEGFLQHLDKLIGPHTTFVEVNVQNSEIHNHIPHGTFGPND